MWANLCNVKESKGKMGILRTRKTLYRAIMDDSTELSVHIALLKRYRAELSALGSVIEDDDFSMLILSSLPDLWDPPFQASGIADLAYLPPNVPTKQSDVRLFASYPLMHSES